MSAIAKSFAIDAGYNGLNSTGEWNQMYSHHNLHIHQRKKIVRQIPFRRWRFHEGGKLDNLSKAAGLVDDA